MADSNAYEGLSFEQAMKELEKIVGLLDNGEVTLEESIDLYQRGVSLAAICTNKLSEIENRVRILTNPEQSDTEKDFTDSDDSEAGESIV